MDLAVSCGIIVFLLVYIVFKEVIAFKERDLLMNKVMAKDYVDYGSLELQKQALKQEPTDKRVNAVKF